AEEAADTLRNGLPLVNKKIKGDLILGGEDLTSPFEFDLQDGRKIALAGLPGQRQFAREDFRAGIEVQGCVFDGRVVLAGLGLKKDVDVVGTRFCADVDLQHSVFDQSVAFYGCSFEGKANFSDAMFWGTVHFDRTSFSAPADFFHTMFQKGAGFSRVVFHAYCSFSQSRFASSMILTPCLDFSRVVCHEAAYFLGARFDGVADFSGTQFRRLADFSDAVFRYVKLSKTQFGWMELTWEQIGRTRLLFGPIVLSGVDVTRETLTDKEFEQYFRRRADAPLPEKHRQYDILKGIFLKQGDFVSADACFYDWKQIERTESTLGWNPEHWFAKAFHYLNWASCGYGVKPIRTLFFATILILLFGLAYTVLDPSVAPTFSALFSHGSVDAFFSALPGNVERSFMAFMNFTSEDAGLGPTAHKLFLVEQLLGWFTLLLFVATYTRILLR
ncbi:MAG: pentapeptide repeat-containing protein, partial [Rhodothermales bacterium]